APHPLCFSKQRTINHQLFLSLTHTHTHTHTLTHKCNVFLVETLAQLALLIHNKLIIIRGIMCVYQWTQHSALLRAPAVSLATVRQPPSIEHLLPSLHSTKVRVTTST